MFDTVIRVFERKQAGVDLFVAGKHGTNDFGGDARVRDAVGAVAP